MKVHELIARLERLPAGADVLIYQTGKDYGTCFEIDCVSGGDVSADFIGNVYLDKGKKQ
jgi:predicted hydrocarbon binding protein